MDTVKETAAQTDRRRRLVVKIGSSTLTTSESSIDYDYLDSLSAQIADLREEGWDVVIVSSGAIASGLEALGIKERPKDMPHLQAAASVGQSALSAAYAKAFARFDITTSLVLLTRRDTADREAYLHARDTLSTLLEMSVVPIVNENDSVATDEIEFGDNDTLSAIVAAIAKADLLVLLSDIDGLYTDDPNVNPGAEFISYVESISDEMIEMAKGSSTSYGTGGMSAKIYAAGIANDAGTDMAIINGENMENVNLLMEGEPIGTVFKAHKTRHFHLKEYLER